ncbi:hypothetical protein EHQ53_14155 [Leptospira langatensis]|uniref:Uncharacterized protein n=1 Tax=Leptospira langatensis TaxID=2484983 RepID=A0ABY2M999_9LEPT|nr:hypothetical protein [Leptospira langatensis]TGL39661.1 hypothetical protein EHQ53_14155 [Leptospira langatensis]
MKKREYRIVEWISDGEPGWTIQRKFLFFFWKRLSIEFWGASAYSFSENKIDLEEQIERMKNGINPLRAD